jgi:hypothetical protein
MTENVLSESDLQAKSRSWLPIAAGISVALVVVAGLLLLLIMSGRSGNRNAPAAAGTGADLVETAVSEEEDLPPAETPLPAATPVPTETPTPLPTMTPLPTETPTPQPISISIEAPVLVPFGPPGQVRWSITIPENETGDPVSVQIVNSGHVMLKSDVNTNEAVTRQTLRAGDSWVIEAYIDPGTGDGALELALTIRGDTDLISLPFVISDTPAVVYESATVTR